MGTTGRTGQGLKRRAAGPITDCPADVFEPCPGDTPGGWAGHVAGTSGVWVVAP